MNERHARAFLTLLTEPCDTAVHQRVQARGAVQTVQDLYHAHHDELAARLAPRWPREITPDNLEHWYVATVTRTPLLHFVVPGDPDYPTQMQELGDTAPYGLWVRSSQGAYAMLRELSAGPSIAMVGARAATSYGEHITGEIAGELASSGYPIVSGAASGIDGAAHRTALAGGNPTVAFLAAGVDRPYPAGHAELINRIVAGGAVISEVPPGSTPTKWRFLARNRLIAAFSSATVVVEAGWRSGSISTAGHARALGRPLGAVPGPITSAASAGCHRLIREGATLITSADDVLELLGRQNPTAQPVLAPDQFFGSGS
jgi:DNA processing protein